MIIIESKRKKPETILKKYPEVIVVDVSTSMLAQDFKPNRVEALKEIAQDFIEKRPNDNIGLAVFAGEAYTQCPLTTDHTVLMNHLTVTSHLSPPHVFTQRT